MATHSSILAWRIPWIEDLAGYSSWSRKELDMTEGRSACIHTHTHTHSNYCIHATIQIAEAYINMLLLIVYKIQCNIQCIVRL